MSRFLLHLILFSAVSVSGAAPEVEVLATGFRFTEGPALAPDGELFFTDIPNRRIHTWNEADGLATFREDSGAANGLMFDREGHLLVCEGGERVLSRIDAQGEREVLARSYEGKAFNSPNDLWIDPQGGIYFTDPRYGNRDHLEQDGEHVYYLTPDRRNVLRVIDDMVRPNGLIGTPDGQTLYVADHGGGATYRYRIETDGSLSDKQLFAPQGSDGMSIDAQGKVYLTDAAIDVYGPDGTHLNRIELPERPTNVIVAAEAPLTLFATAPRSVYRIVLPEAP